jgi:hypothetical protein
MVVNCTERERRPSPYPPTSPFIMKKKMFMFKEFSKILGQYIKKPYILLAAFLPYQMRPSQTNKLAFEIDEFSNQHSQLSSSIIGWAFRLNEF